MLTPFGNPQNLYLYSYYGIDSMEFVKIMMPSFLAATVLIVVCCLFVKATSLTLKNNEDYVLNKNRTLIYTILFVASILIVFRIVPYILGTAVITIALLFGILSCQFISNVPSAVLLSHFTGDYASLLPAVNIGGCGTLIALLASLITFSEFKKHQPEKVNG